MPSKIKVKRSKGKVVVSYKDKQVTLPVVGIKELTPKQLDVLAERVHKFAGFVKKDIK